MAKKEAAKDSHEELIKEMRSLTKRIDHLVSLFEEASKHVAEVESAESKISSLSTRLEELLEQNKTIARGLLMLEKYVRGKTGLTQQSMEPKPLSEYSAL